MTKRAYEVQVSDGHYTKSSYLSQARWSTYSVIIENALVLRPERVLEIGPGPGLVTQLLRLLGCSVKTLDLDPKIQPDYLMSATDPDIASRLEKFDLTIASEIFEHVEYPDFLAAMRRLSSVSEYFILTLPDTNEKALNFGIRLRLPIFNNLSQALKIRFSRQRHIFDGQHYWEIGKTNYTLRQIKKDLCLSGWDIVNDFLNIDNPYHRCFILKAKGL